MASIRKIGGEMVCSSVWNELVCQDFQNGNSDSYKPSTKVKSLDLTFIGNILTFNLAGCNNDPGPAEEPPTSFPSDEEEVQDDTDNTQGDTPVEMHPRCHPADEITGNDIDENCNGMIDGDEDQDGITSGDGDCNDLEASINPNMPEIFCNSLDDNCYRGDDDADCDGVTMDDGDCGDNSFLIFPGAMELCRNNLDDNCDGTLDEGCPAREDSVGCPESRFSTITEAIQGANSVFLCNGSYNQFLEITERDVTLEGESMEGVVLQSPSPGPDVVSIQDSNVTFKNLTVTGGAKAESDQRGGGIRTNSTSPSEHSLLLYHCSVTANEGIALSADSLDEVDIRYSKIDNNDFGAVLTYVNQIFISHSAVSDNRVGLILQNLRREARIESSHITGNGIPALVVSGIGNSQGNGVRLDLVDDDINNNKQSRGEYSDGLCFTAGGLLLGGVHATLTDSRIRENEEEGVGAISLCTYHGGVELVTRNSEISNNIGGGSVVKLIMNSSDFLQSIDTQWIDNRPNLVELTTNPPFDLTNVGNNFTCRQDSCAIDGN